MVTAISMNTITTRPNTASLFLSRRFQASRASEVPFTGSIFSAILKLLVPYPGIKKSVHHIDDKVKYHDHDRQECGNAQHKRLVAVGHRSNKNVSQTRYRKNALDDDGAGKEPGKCRPGI